MGTSRTKNSARNASIAIISKAIILIVTFICRTVFIEVLGAEYLGINGLFSNILRLLSFAELGAGTAIIYKMYKPIAEHDKEKIKSLAHLYKTVYNIIGVTILILGFALIPFLPFLMKDLTGIDRNQVVLFYVLFLANSSISYFFAYKKSLITAHQDEHIVSIINLFATVATNILEIVFLLMTHNYVAYLLVQICGTIVENILASRKADKMYPYIKDAEYQRISDKERKSFFNDVRVLFLYQVANVLLLGTDNVIISTFVGVTEVGLLSNYTLITSNLFVLLDAMFNALTPSIGNLNTIKNKEKKEKVFYQILFMLFVVYGYVSVMAVLLINKFIVIWLGDDYVLNMSISIVLGLDLFISGMRYVYYTYRNTTKLFRKKVFLPFASVLTNVLLSILLVNILPAENHWKIFGVLFATPFAKLVFNLSYEPYMIHKYMFDSSVRRYYKKYAYYAFVTILAGVLAYFAIRFIPLGGILGFVVDGVVATVIVLGIFWVFSVRTRQYREVKEKMVGLVNSKSRS